MQVLSRFTVRTKLALGFGTMLVFIVAVAAFAIYQLSLISARSAQIADVHLAGVRDALLISESATRYRVREYRLAMTKPEELAKVVQRMQKAVEAVDKHRKSYESSITGDEERALYQAFEQAWSTYLATSGRMKDRLQAGDREGALGVMTTDSLQHFDAVVAALKAMSEFNDKSAHAASEDAARMAAHGRDLIAAVVVAALLLGTWLSWAIAREVSLPLARAVALAEQVAAGDLSQALEDHRQDEVGRLTRALSRMVAQLREVVGQVRHGVASVSAASSEIADGSHDLSSRTEQAAASLQETASAMEELTGTMSHASDTAQQANQLASHAAGSARRGGEVMERVVQNMGQITEASRRMSDIIGVIDAIAFQTNILALNAAVEAARAGEQGRGFAVVATEVRTLAQRSAQAAREIKGLIGASVDTVDSGAGLVKEAGGVMQDIVASVQRVTDLMGELAAAASEQKSGMGQINIAVNQLDQMTQQNAALVEQTAAAASSLSDQALRLDRVVSVFRTGGEADAAAGVQPPARAHGGAGSRRPALSRGPQAAGAAAGAPATTPRTVAGAARGPKPSASPARASTPAPAREAAETADWETF